MQTQDQPQSRQSTRGPHLSRELGITFFQHPPALDTLRDTAGGAYCRDAEAVVDGKLVTSRQPSDLPAFNREMLKLFTARLRMVRLMR